MNRQNHMNRDERVDKPFLVQFRAQLLWLVLAVIVFAAILLAVLTPWTSDSDSSSPALPTPAAQGTPNP
jgi:hypothetical protein